MSLLTLDFEAKSQARLQHLLAGRRTVIATPDSETDAEKKTPAAIAAPLLERASVLIEAPQISQVAEMAASTSDVIINEKLVKLTDVAGRKAVLKESPVSLDLVVSEEDFSKFSLEALKKLAKTAALDLPKQVNKSSVVALLVDAYRSRKAGGPIVREEQNASCSSLR